MSKINQYLEILKQFRKSIYSNFNYASDASMNLLDALSSFQANSVIELSLSPLFQRKHYSVARAIQDYPSGRNPNKVSKDSSTDHLESLCQYLPKSTQSLYHVFALDVTSIKKSYSKKLTEKQFVHCNNPTPGQKPVAVGHHLSCLTIHQDDSQWCLPLLLNRVPLEGSQTEFGLDQVESVIPKYFNDKTCIIAADAKYSNRCSLYRSSLWKDKVLLTRLSPTRVFYQSYLPKPSDASKKGRCQYYGDPFKLNDLSTHCPPNDQQKIIHQTSSGKKWHIYIDRFDHLLMKGKRSCPMYDKSMSLFRITVEDEKGASIYKNPLWLAGAGHSRENILLSDIFKIYNQRFNIEHWFRFSKRHLLLDKFQSASIDHASNWLLFPLLATHMLYHAKDLSESYLRPWELPQSTNLQSPSQIKRAMEKILLQAGTPAENPVPRGIGTGRAHGCRNINQKIDSEINIKSKKPLSNAEERKIIIKLKSDSIDDLSGVELTAKNLPKSGQSLKKTLKQLFEAGEATLEKAA